MDNEIIANSEVVKETVEVAAETAMEELVNPGTVTATFAIGVGIGILTAVAVKKCVIPSIKRKFNGIRKPKYVKYHPVEEDEEPSEEQETETPDAEKQHEEESGEKNKKK